MNATFDITSFIVGMVLGLSISISAIIAAIWLIDTGPEGDAIDKGNVK